MNFETFSKHIPEDVCKKITNRTLKVWHLIHSYISENGECCTYEAGLLEHYIYRNEISISQKTIMGHLRRMSEVGLLESNRVILKERGLHTWFKTESRTFNIYTLPGMHPDFTKEH